MSCTVSVLPSYVPQASFALEESRWYAIYTHPRHEKVVADHLRSKALKVFLPMTATESRWKDRRVRLDSPIFPGYVFTKIELSQRGRVLAVPGVVRFLSFNGAPAPIDDCEIENVRLCLDSGLTAKCESMMQVGQRVRVNSGLLEGLEGYISRCKDDRRLIVPISVIHQSISVEINLELLEPAEDCRFGQYHADGLHR